MMPTTKQPYSYNKGPYRLKDAPGLLLGAAAISGGVYALVRLLLNRKQTQEARQAKVTLRNVNPVAVQGQGQGERGCYR